MVEVGDLRSLMGTRYHPPDPIQEKPERSSSAVWRLAPSPPNSGIFVTHYLVDFTWVNV
jgi:hypothetical protein